MLGADGIIQHESPAIEQIYGFDQDALVGDFVGDYFHPEDRDEVLSAFQTLVERDDHVVKAVEYRHEQADGSYLWVESVASSTPTPTGHYVVNTRDISERKQRERHLEALNERLEAFVSMVSHDLRNPLAIADGRLELAREACDSPHLDDVAQAHDRMGALIDELLALARGGKALGDLEPVALSALTRECWDPVGHHESTVVTATSRSIYADANRLRQLLENVLRNALDHAGDDVTVTVGDLQDGFFIEDDGPGIPADDRQRVLEPGVSTSERGTGLGLSIAPRSPKRTGGSSRWRRRPPVAPGSRSPV